VKSDQLHSIKHRSYFKRQSVILRRFLRQRNYLALRLIILFMLILVPVLLFPDTEFTRYSEYKVGAISPNEVRAPFTFPVYKSGTQLAAERKEAENLIAPVFDRVQDAARSELANLDELFSYFVQLRLSPKPIQYTDNEGKIQTFVPQQFDSLKNHLNKSFGINIVETRWQLLIGEEPLRAVKFSKPVKKDSSERKLRKAEIGKYLSASQMEEFKEDLSVILSDLYALGIINMDKNNFKSPISPITIRAGQQETTEFIKNVNDIDEARYRAQDLLRNYYKDGRLINIGYEILSLFITPNIVYNEKETKRRREEAVNSVPQTYGFVLAGDVIVQKNETVTPAIHQQLLSLETAWLEKRTREGGMSWLLPYLGRGLLVFALMFFLLGYLYLFRRDIFENVKLLTLAVSVIVIEILFYYWFVYIFDFPVLTVPIVLSAVLLTTLFDIRVGVIATISIAYLVGAMQGNEYTSTMVLSFVGSVACFAVHKFSRRRHVFTSILWVSLAYIFIIITISFVQYTDLSVVLRNQLPYALISGILSLLVAFGCLVLFETIFDICTTFTLLELSDSNHPLLQQLAMKAPGTYHHSIIVGNLAKAAAEAIGGNALLARVGAMYHDIGKMDMSEYFVENQTGGVNKHDTLAPRMSALILASHIKAGLELAEKYRLPRLIRSYIPEHHGNQLMAFFYHKATEKKNDDETIAEWDFRYPGPKPKTKESGIIMLADGVEAATHSLKEPNANRIRAMVYSIIENRLQDGELDECELTVGDLKTVAEAFIPILLSIYHVRPEYPGQEEKLSLAAEETETVTN